MKYPKDIKIENTKDEFVWFNKLSKNQIKGTEITNGLNIKIKRI